MIKQVVSIKIIVFAVMLTLCHGRDIQAGALHDAVSAGDIAAVKNLVNEGTPVREPDENGFEPIHLAVRNGRYDIVIFLISSGADVNAKGLQGETPLHLAVQNNRLGIAELLLANHANVNDRDSEGKAPLQYSSGSDMSGMLIKHGAAQTEITGDLKDIETDDRHAGDAIPESKIPDSTNSSDEIDSASGSIETLGYYNAAKLNKNELFMFETEGFKPKEDGYQFMIVVLSLPTARMMPTEAEYAQIKHNRDNPDKLSPIDWIKIYDPDRFSLILPNGYSTKGSLISMWSKYLNWGEGYTLEALNGPVDLKATEEIAVAFIVPENETLFPCKIQLDRDEPVNVIEKLMKP
ncbi:ankyrin repeat domain-containing protein [bacterium]|nr:ankyrin repeat domain-containing protein [candidate division CSSED10-310 bacterium]